jgi:hypothetical protein
MMQPIGRFDPAGGIPASQRVIALLTETKIQLKQRLQLLNHLQQSEIEDIGKWLRFGMAEFILQVTDCPSTILIVAQVE